MSCNGCRILRKGCSENCILRPCLQWIESPEAQGHATVFVAKFFGRAGLMSFISAVPESQRPALFQSLLFEACGRTVNPVNGAVGLLSTGNWHVCQAAVQTVLHGGKLQPIPEFLDEVSEAEVTCVDMFRLHQDPNPSSLSKSPRRRLADAASNDQLANFGHSLEPKVSSSQGIGEALNFQSSAKKRRPRTPSMNSEESVTTPCFESGGFGDLCAQIGGGGELKVLKLFN